MKADLPSKIEDRVQQSDTLLMQRYAAGDLQSFETLYKRHKDSVYRYFMRHIPDTNIAEDLYQEIWQKVIMQANQYQATAKFTTWLYTLAHNKLVDHVRHLSVVNKVVVARVDEQQHSVEIDHQPSHQNQPEGDLTNIRLAESLAICIQQLPQVQKDGFLLKEEAGLTVKDIANIHNISLEASKSRLRYAFETLRKCLHLKTGRALV